VLVEGGVGGNDDPFINIDSLDPSSKNEFRFELELFLERVKGRFIEEFLDLDLDPVLKLLLLLLAKGEQS